ncbi:nickel ABC transporter substrate-binding protein [Virgibacillus profundi]|uniref:Nickel ABC transporter substrate-binding protein n=1 Tax=Virgibacillus profundi TaxID=2024555 RepID=A0A2A2IF71_9BACI|nr:ABC transporter substrate-binding protein [Virgibacillus profundi]PAV30651.1 nickel ABC transporter substrate-binding protein [Virgibacillus profundi]PXY54823.1 ABC transporter substrate-binding protein [Virgibacillus profundi]
MKQWNKLMILGVVIVLLSILSACSEQDKEPPTATDTKTDELVLAIGGEPDEGFDPTTGWGQYGSPLFQSTLLKYDENFNVQNDLAKDYSVSDDGLEWTIKLRDDVKFSDGEDLTADDVVFTYKTAKKSGSIIDLSNMDRIEMLDSHSVKITLKKPQSTFIYLLTTIGIVPEHAYDDSYNENPIGSGPFQLVQWSKGQQLIVEANPYYYGKKPYFKKLTFLFLSEDAAFAAAKSGEADVVSVPPTFANEDVAGMHLVELESVDNRGIMFPYVPAGEETKDGYPIGNDVTSDTAIRKAINIAVDREALVDGVLEGYGTPAYTVADNLPWWNPETVIKDNNTEKAKQMLEEAGWTENESGVREKDGLKATFTLLYPAGDQIRQSLSIAFADMIKHLGINVETKGASWNELEKLKHSNPVMMGWGSHNPLEIYNLFSSKTRGQGFYNSNYYSNPVVDKYMSKAMHATSQEEANTYWKKAQWDGKTGFSAKGDASWVWLVNLTHLYFVRNDLAIGDQKIQPHGHGWPVTDFIEKWHWKE